MFHTIMSFAVQNHEGTPYKVFRWNTSEHSGHLLSIRLHNWYFLAREGTLQNIGHVTRNKIVKESLFPLVSSHLPHIGHLSSLVSSSIGTKFMSSLFIKLHVIREVPLSVKYNAPNSKKLKPAHLAGLLYIIQFRPYTVRLHICTPITSVPMWGQSQWARCRLRESMCAALALALFWHDTELVSFCTVAIFLIK